MLRWDSDSCVADGKLYTAILRVSRYRNAAAVLVVLYRVLAEVVDYFAVQLTDAVYLGRLAVEVYYNVLLFRCVTEKCRCVACHLCDIEVFPRKLHVLVKL